MINNKTILQKISVTVSRWASSTYAFLLSIVAVLLWLVTGPFFHYSNTWLIAITVITDVVIFIMVFSIQNTQFRDSKAIQLKLNELIVADKKARDTFVGLETLADNELAALDDEFKKLLAELEVHPVMHKLHESIKQEKAKRPTFYQQTERFVDALFKPLGSDNHKK